MYFADITIPQDLACKLAAETDPRTATDTGYIVKSALNEGFGPQSIRPWRILDETSGLFRVLGAIETHAAIKPTPASRRLGIVAESISFDISQGDSVVLDIIATPVKRITRRDGENHQRVGAEFRDIATRKIVVDGRAVYTHPHENERLAAYGPWLADRMNDDTTGVIPIDAPEIISTRPHRQHRKRHGVPAVIITPCMQARIQVQVVHPGRLAEFVRAGLKKMKDVGLGSVVPVPVLEELAA